MLEWIGKRYVRMQKNRHEGNGFSLQEEGGFALIELLIVIIIIGILAAIAIPVFLSQRVKAQQAAAKSDARNAGAAQVMWYAENDTFTDNLADLNTQGFRSSQGVETVVDAAKTDANNYCVESQYGTAAAPVATTEFYMSDDSGGVRPGNCP